MSHEVIVEETIVEVVEIASDETVISEEVTEQIFIEVSGDETITVDETIEQIEVVEVTSEETITINEVTEQIIIEEGEQGAQGAQGIPGIGIPTGGTTGQFLKKLNNSDYATVWADVPEPDLSPFWKRDGTSEATGDWNLGSYGISVSSFRLVDPNNIGGYATIVCGGSNDFSFLDSYGNQSYLTIAGLNLYDSAMGEYPVLKVEDNIFYFYDQHFTPSDILHKDSYFYDVYQSNSGRITLQDDEYVFYTAGGSLATVSGGFGNFYNGLLVNGATATTIYTNFANSYVGFGLTGAAAHLHSHLPSATANYLKITNTSTGITSNDGFDIGISSAGVVELRNREVTAMQFFNGNVNYMSLASNAPTLTLDSQGSNSANAGTIIMRTASGSESTTITFNALANVFDFQYGATVAYRIDSNAKSLIRQGAVTLRGALSAVINRIDTVGNVGIGEDDLYSYSSPSSTFNQNGDCLEVEYAGNFAANANNKRIRMYFGGQLLFDTTALALNGGTWRICASLYRVSTTSLRAIIDYTSSNTTLSFKQTYTAWSGNVLQTNILKITGEATANNDVTANVSCIKWIPVA